MDILKNNKNFGVRKDDRLYEVGDYLYLREYLPADEYTGKRDLAGCYMSIGVSFVYKTTVSWQ